MPRSARGLQDAVRCVAHRKVFREFTGLRLAQTLIGHEGVIWRVAFDATGALMASAGKDRAVRVWRSRRGPIDRCAHPHACAPPRRHDTE